jgi:hypothetical protein
MPAKSGIAKALKLFQLFAPAARRDQHLRPTAGISLSRLRNPVAAVYDSRIVFADNDVLKIIRERNAREAALSHDQGQRNP